MNHAGSRQPVPQVAARYRCLAFQARAHRARHWERLFPDRHGALARGARHVVNWGGGSELMAFCTTCGANVTGTFCSQCGTPAGAAAQAQPAAASAPYGQPVAAGGLAMARKTSPIVWILIVVLGLFVLGGIGVVGVIGYVAHRARQAGLAFDRGRDGNVTFHARGADGKDATVEFGASAGKLPAWIPVYPGSDGRATFTVRGTADGAEGGNFTFTTPDDGSKVKSFYADKCKDLGMKVNLETTTPEGGMFIAADEGGDRRSLTVVILSLIHI